MKWAIFCAVFLGVALRIFCLFHHLPYFAHIDEKLTATISLNLSLHDLNPHDFIYPGLLYYLLFPLTAIFKLNLPLSLFNFDYLAMVVLIGRMFIFSLSIASIIITYFIGKTLFNSRIGLAASFLLALNPQHVSLSCIFKPDMLMSLLILAAFFNIGKLYIATKPRTINYILSGFFIGLATAAKYTGILVVISLAAAHFLKANREADSSNKKLFLALILTIFTFFITNPFILLDTGNFLKDITSELNTAVSGFPRAPLANKLGWLNYPPILYSILGPVISLLAIGGLLSSLCRRSKKDLLVFSFPLTYYIVIGMFKNSQAHYIFPVIPFVILIAAQFLISVINAINLSGLTRKTKHILITLFCIAALAPASYEAIYYNKWINQKDTRITAKAWILANVPAGSRILMEGVSADIPIIFGRDSTPYHIEVVSWAQAQNYSQLFKKNKFDFVIIATAHKNMPAGIKALYDFMGQNLPLAKEFKPSRCRPASAFIYNPLYNPDILIYDGRRGYVNTSNTK